MRIAQPRGLGWLSTDQDVHDGCRAAEDRAKLQGRAYQVRQALCGHGFMPKQGEIGQQGRKGAARRSAGKDEREVSQEFHARFTQAISAAHSISALRIGGAFQLSRSWVPSGLQRMFLM